MGTLDYERERTETCVYSSSMREERDGHMHDPVIERGETDRYAYPREREERNMSVQP
jgi:hypothetical protein